MSTETNGSLLFGSTERQARFMAYSVWGVQCGEDCPAMDLCSAKDFNGCADAMKEDHCIPIFKTWLESEADDDGDD